MGLVSGYGSDSDSEAGSDAIIAPSAAPSSGLSSLLPAPKSAGPSTSKPRGKRQIKVGGLSDADDDDDDDDQASGKPKKKPKMQASTASASAHSLFGMLPAPTRAPPPHSSAKGKNANVRAGEDDGDGEEGTMQATQEEQTPKPKKGNADFRAMLGLKPVAGGQAKQGPAEMEEKRVKSIPTQVSSISPQAQAQSSENLKARGPQTNTPPSASSPPTKATSKPHSEPALEPDVDFFSISSDSRPDASTPTSSLPVTTLSAAPTIAEDDPYPGWHQNPDGTWIPVTPAAQEEYERHQASNTDHTRMIERLREQEGIDIDRLQHVDLQSTRAEWEKKPLEARIGSSAALDAKYAQAAGVLPVEENKDNNAREKKTNFRAKQKGQLTSLFAQAEERREELEDKWAQGKQNKRAAASRYGF